MVSWLGFQGESRNRKIHMIEALNARLIAYTDQVLEIPNEAYDRPAN